MKPTFIPFLIWLIGLTSVSAISEPLIYSTFDGGSGDPGEINGTLESVEGQIADALTFARDDANFVDYGDVASPGTGSLTVSFWINPNQTSGGAFFPIGKGNRSSGAVGWSFFLENDVIIPRANYEGGGGDLRLGLNHPISVEEGWVHMALVIDNETGAFTAYYNGQASGADGAENGWSLGGGGGQTNTFEPGQDFSPSENLLVGRRSSEGASFDGGIDDVAIWAEALPAADITQIYERGLDGQGIASNDRVVAQSVPAKSVGNVATGASFGMDFEVRAPVLLTDLGAFDSISDGLFQSPTVELWSRDNAGTPDDLSDDAGNEIIATALFSNEAPGTLEGGVRFKALSEPITLPVGDYTIVGYGWGAGEEMSDGRQRGNTGVGTLADVFQLAFVGSGRTGGGGEFPGTAEEAGPPNLFGAGNFIVRLLAEDSDGDGLEDGWENFNFGNLNQNRGGDFDSDGSSNGREFAADTNPNKEDTDDDGLNDGAEDTAGSNPLLGDTDGDGLTDGAEVNDHNTSPILADTDSDNFVDGVEIALETDPTNAGSSPDETSVFLAVSGKSWDDPSAWSDGQAPHAGRNYFVLPQLADTLLTPAGSPEFAGDSLTLSGEGATLILQPDPTGTVTITNLAMEDATLTNGAVGEIKLSGNTQINGTMTIGFTNANSTLELNSTLSGGGLTVAYDGETEEEPSRTVRLTGAGNTLTGDVSLKQVRVAAESSGSLGGGNLSLDNAAVEPGYNINTPSKTLDLSGDGTRFLLNGQHVLRQISITGTPFITDAGMFTRDDFVAIDAVFETIFAEESTGNFTIVGNSGDSDEDGLLDSWEIENFGDLATADSAGDPDEDGLDNGGEFTASADPNKKDTDDDGLEDGEEVNTHGTSPALADSDEDGVNDGDEVAGNTSPKEADTDGDGLSDGEEIAQNTDATKADTDGDGINDGTEVALGGDPLDPNNAPNALLADLLFYAPFDTADLNLGAATAAEQGPNAFEGTIEGEDVGVDVGQIAQSAVFPGVDTDFISFTDPALNAGTEPFSVSFWFKVNVMQNAFMVSRGNRGSGNAGWSVWFENGNLHTRANGVGLGGGDRVGKNFPGVQEGEWYHLAFVFDRTPNKMISYVNGSTEGWNVGGGGGQTDNLVPGADFTAEEDLLIGARTGGGFAFDGQVDDLALWKRALTNEEITALHEAGLSGRGALDDPSVNNDIDGDGLPNDYETANGLDPNSDDAAADPDSDGLANLDEFNRSTDPQNADSDEDGLDDGAEIAQETDPTKADTDEDGLSDGDEVNTHQTSPTLADTDSDGLTDADEINEHETDPLLADSDEDGFGDQAEVESGSDPNLAASVPVTDLEQGLFAYYSFDGDSITDAVDGRDGTKMNGGPDTTTGGLFRQGATFDGGQSGQDNHYLDLGAHADAFGSLSVGTFSAWIKPNTEDLLTDVLTIMAISDNVEGSVEARFWVSNGGAFGVGTVAYGVRGGPASGSVVAREVNVLDGQWHHVAISVGEDSAANLYVDGVLQATETVSFLDIPNANAAALGRNEDSGGGQWYYAGRLDDVAIWDRPLTIAEAFVLHRQGRQGQALRSDGVVEPLPPLENVGFNDSNAFSVTLTNGVTADIEYSTDLINWEVIAPGVTGTVSETDATRMDAPAGYYRAKQ